MFTKSIAVAVLALLAAGSAVEAADHPAAAPQSVKQEMKAQIEPLSNSLFAVAGDADPANGPDAPKVSDQRWDEAASAADVLTRVAEGLNGTDRAKPDSEWAGMAKEMHDISARARKAAMTRDGAGLAQAANDLSDNCSACHAKFRPQTGS